MAHMPFFISEESGLFQRVMQVYIRTVKKRSLEKWLTRKGGREGRREGGRQKKSICSP